MGAEFWAGMILGWVVTGYVVGQVFVPGIVQDLTKQANAKSRWAYRR